MGPRPAGAGARPPHRSAGRTGQGDPGTQTGSHSVRRKGPAATLHGAARPKGAAAGASRVTTQRPAPPNPVLSLPCHACGKARLGEGTRPPTPRQSPGALRPNLTGPTLTPRVSAQLGLRFAVRTGGGGSEGPWVLQGSSVGQGHWEPQPFVFIRAWSATMEFWTRIQKILGRRLSSLHRDLPLLGPGP